MAHLRGTSAGAWDIRRHVEHCRSVEHRGAHQGRFHSPRCFSEARVRRKGSGAHGESTCQSTTATVRPALLHWNFEAALRTASVGVFARLRVIPKTCILHMNFSTLPKQSNNCPETEQHRSTKNKRPYERENQDGFRCRCLCGIDLLLHLGAL